VESNNDKFILRRFYLSKLEKFGNLIKSFSLTEKVVFWVLFFCLAVSTLSLISQINKNFLINVPAKGGNFTEGVVGSPRFINPLLAISNADRDILALVYSGLMKATPEGQLIPDLAESYSISEDGLTYTFILRDDATFHDGTPVTTEDIGFTIRTSLDNVIKSPKRANWEGVAVNIVDEKQIQFVLKTPYSPFLENTTLGILPKHIWGKIDPEQFAFSQFNIEPIGSGPYKITSTKMDSSGILERYEFKSFNNYTLGEPYIPNLAIKFYPNEETLINAYNKKAIESINTISPEKAKKLEEAGNRIESVPLPRIFGIFFNQNKNSIFTDAMVRKALNKSIDREKIISQVLSGYGTPIYGPVPTTSQYFDESIEGETDVQEAIDILEDDGWKINEETKVREKTIKKITTPLELTLTTSDAPELKTISEMVKADWEKIGAKVSLKIFESGDLNQNIIRPREYDALLFGEIIGRDMDLFAFWHSSQRNDPGLNIAMYTNSSVDKSLEQTRATGDEDIRKDNYTKFQKEIAKDTPAVFVYSPDFIYVMPEKIKGISLGQIIMPSERFLDVHNWYIETENIWKIFSK